MDLDFKGKEDYQKDFDPRLYLDTFYSVEGGPLVTGGYLPLMLKNLFTTFASGAIRGDTLIDIGSGASIYQFLSACEFFREIIASDYSDQCLQELKKWLKKESGTFDWSSTVKFVCELEGDREKWAEKEEKVRRTVTRVLKCDVTKSNPLEPLTLPQADCLLSFLCLQSACMDLESFCSALKNITSLLKPGGYLVTGGVLGSSRYRVGQKEFLAFVLEKEILERAACEAGYVVERLDVQPRIDLSSMYLTNYQASFFLVARKQTDMK
ncbi:indolethylamine N-methyltransferase-like [Rhinatrema bivittatum]|uniref:indolethylamine N-methyltransferase-like n=1 Tax=Rhinatrema bivittatum TaxID=194408 RepID=UPI00112A51A0|nr:indolethylamine N-methyltransferase-like [Rhinatrema bivittatum]